MQNTPDIFEQELAGLYNEPMPETEVEEMADRLSDFVGLLLEIEADSR